MPASTRRVYLFFREDGKTSQFFRNLRKGLRDIKRNGWTGEVRAVSSDYFKDYAPFGYDAPTLRVQSELVGAFVGGARTIGGAS